MDESVDLETIAKETHGFSGADLAELINEAALNQRATPSDLRLGREIAARGGVELVESTPSKVIARVQPTGGQRRTVELTMEDNELKCRCT